jgi:XRE family aerobic/anaerobic benzoate catabolism transcriptional regulator
MAQSNVLREPDPRSSPEANGERHPSLVELGARLRSIRARRGLTRKATAITAGVSERYLANLEAGLANPSVLILQQVSGALECPVAELIGDPTTASPEWLLIRELLVGKSDADLRRVRQAIGELFRAGIDAAKERRIALIGLRGAGKSTLGKRLADDLDVPFIELSREVERIAGCDIRQIYDLYGANAYRRYERRALDDVIQRHTDAVIATPGGIVVDAITFNQLLQHTTTIWLQAAPEEHMQRVAQQGDLRPMAASNEAMDDLRRILAGRSAFYAKADLKLDTTGKALDQAGDELVALVHGSRDLAHH